MGASFFSRSSQGSAGDRGPTKLAERDAWGRVCDCTFPTVHRPGHGTPRHQPAASLVCRDRLWRP